MCVGKVVHCNNDVENYIWRKKQPIKDRLKKNEFQYTEDILAVITRYTKTILFGISEIHVKFCDTVFYRILTKTTQPAHLITAVAVILLAFLVMPNRQPHETQLSPVVTLIYLASFSAHFGAQIWMTFISGLALYFSLPRHTFGHVQKVLFPKYFLLNATLSLITLVVFLRSNNKNLAVTEILIQAIGMSVCFLTQLVIRLYLTPPLLVLISEKNEIEKSVGVGLEVGKLDPGKLKNCQNYLKVHQKFRKIHMSIAIGNLIAMACTMLHLYYLSQKLTITLL